MLTKKKKNSRKKKGSQHTCASFLSISLSLCRRCRARVSASRSVTLVELHVLVCRSVCVCICRQCILEITQRRTIVLCKIKLATFFVTVFSRVCVCVFGGLSLRGLHRSPSSAFKSTGTFLDSLRLSMRQRWNLFLSVCLP